jgi:predicted RNase H-like HicB family nuclease
MDCQIEFEREDDGRWIAEIVSLPGVMAYGTTKQEAQSKVQAIALRVIG